MLLLKILRPPLEQCKDATEGNFYINGVHACWTLEDPSIDWATGTKLEGNTSIPPGRYPVTIDYSNRFKKDMLHILNVPHFDGIRIHGGNTVADTLGCPLVGKVRTSPNDGRIADCKPAVDLIFGKVKDALAAGKEVWIDIEHESPRARAA